MRTVEVLAREWPGEPASRGNKMGPTPEHAKIERRSLARPARHLPARAPASTLGLAI
jgi:hypothetical protein